MRNTSAVLLLLAIQAQSLSLKGMSKAKMKSLLQDCSWGLPDGSEGYLCSRDWKNTDIICCGSPTDRRYVGCNTLTGNFFVGKCPCGQCEELYGTGGRCRCEQGICPYTCPRS